MRDAVMTVKKFLLISAVIALASLVLGTIVGTIAVERLDL